MISYYKHTNGEAFTLDNEDYVGFFHVLSGFAYTGKNTTDDSVLLTLKNTFISDVYMNEFEFDATYKNIASITPSYTNSFDLLNYQGLNRIMTSIDDNNTISYKNLVIGTPTVFKFEENDGFFYGLSSISEDIPQNIPIKRQYSHIIPFSDTVNYPFMDNITTGTFVVNSRNEFKYLCSDGNVNYVLVGDFDGSTSLTVDSVVPNIPYYNETHRIYSDIDNSKFLFVKNEKIEIYDSSNYDECDNLILVDEIDLLPTTTIEFIWDSTDISYDKMDFKFNSKYSTDNPNNPKYIKFGYNKRTSLSSGVLTLLNKYSSDIIQTINLTTYGLGDIIDLDIRDTDDAVIILNEKSDGLYVCYFDSYDLTTLSNRRLYSIDDTADTQRVEFTKYDSNVFITSNKKEYQTRYLSNPSYPSGRLEVADLYYLRDYKWDTTDEMYKYVNIPWNSASFESNKYNNLGVSTVIKHNKMYSIFHNIGRLYIMSQPLNDRFLNFIPLELEKFFSEISCSESSVGLYLNSVLSNILKDTLNIFNKSFSSYTFEERSVISRQIQDFILQTENLHLNGNETINVVALQRIIILISDIQRKLLPST